MGFGFNFLFIFVIIPLFIILLLILLVSWTLTKKIIFGRIIGFIFFGILGLSLVSSIIHFLTEKTKLTKKDYYGEYIVNRDYFKGKQADWQYENFRFEIKKNDSIYFYLTNKEKILKIYRGTIKTNGTYSSERLLINMDQPTYHIMSSNPTTYRTAWNFYLVFYSEKFNNVYFKKGKWKPIKQ